MEKNKNFVRPKKHLGQHFLKDENVAKRIVDSLEVFESYDEVLEIGPGTGVLTKYLLLDSRFKLTVDEIDNESVIFLKENFEGIQIITQDFLKLDLNKVYENKQFGIIGNFPYNISSQIFFKVLENRDKVSEVVCMIQKEVAQRIASIHGNKQYGILSVILQAFYDIEYLFDVSPGVFIPPPKVMSGVIRLKNKRVVYEGLDEKMFFKVVKQGFSTRRKTLRNALKSLPLPDSIKDESIFDKRAEQLSVQEFIDLTIHIQNAI